MAGSAPLSDAVEPNLLEAKLPTRSELLTEEERRLIEDARREQNWKRWGPYLADRQWGTVREDYSANGDAWTYFPHDHARSRAYRWGEDGLIGFTDRECRLCFAVALWNEKDPILKERLFGLSNPEGNHGEDVKELYYYLDSTPTHSYMKALYKYPQSEFPYQRLITENACRGKHEREFELLDTGIFHDDRYFDVFAEYAKSEPDDVLIKLTIVNRGPNAADLHVLPTFWFRNTWIWGCTHEGCTVKPRMRRVDAARPDLGQRGVAVDTWHETLGEFQFVFEGDFQSDPAYVGPKSAAATTESTGDMYPAELLFTDNHTNNRRLYGTENPSKHVKDAFHEYIIHKNRDAIDRTRGTKCAAHYILRAIPPNGGTAVLRARLYPKRTPPRNGQLFGEAFEAVFAQRVAEADLFYGRVLCHVDTANEAAVARQAYAGLLWNKQFYHYIIKDWLEGDPEMPPPPGGEARRRYGRNADWRHLFNRDVISMPDKWEFPWYATWDLAFHLVAFADIDPFFAKAQLLLFLREWYMHPNGQLPAYEWNFSDVNPPVHAWAALKVYNKTAEPEAICRGHNTEGKRFDVAFLERVFQKLLMNFTWWVNRKDPHGRNVFSGGFLGLDNIGLFDRSQPLPNGGSLEQADATAWMAFYCITMLAIALELAQFNSTYEDIASKFFEHFVAIVDAINAIGDRGLWDMADGFYYDQITIEHSMDTGERESRSTPLKVRSLVGIIPILAVEVCKISQVNRLPGFKKRLDWFLKNRKDLARHITFPPDPRRAEQLDIEFLLAIPSRAQLERVVEYMLDENEFLSPFGVRSLSKVYCNAPYSIHLDGRRYEIRYVPGESDSNLFGGNSNWRGPIWIPINYLIVEALKTYHRFYGKGFTVEFPKGSGTKLNLAQVAHELERRLVRLFLPDPSRGGQRPCHGDELIYATKPIWRELILFYEHFDGDTGRGIGANHQTGWTALVTQFIHSRAAEKKVEAM